MGRKKGEEGRDKENREREGTTFFHASMGSRRQPFYGKKQNDREKEQKRKTKRSNCKATHKTGCFPRSSFPLCISSGKTSLFGMNMRRVEWSVQIDGKPRKSGIRGTTITKLAKIGEGKSKGLTWWMGEDSSLSSKDRRAPATSEMVSESALVDKTTW